MKKAASFVVLFSIFQMTFGQIVPPFFSDFDHPGDTLGWSHYATAGTDDWKCAIPGKINIPAAFSLDNAWVTKPGANYTSNSTAYLESPSFDLSDTSIVFFLQFYHKRYMASGTYGNIEYSIDGGSTWILLNGANDIKKNWYNSGTTWNANGGSTYKTPAHSLEFLQGQSDVRFRFHFSAGASPGEGWAIDNFMIDYEYYNLYATRGDTIHQLSKRFADFDVKSVFGFYNQYSNTFNFRSDFYLSTDTILDAADTLIFTRNTIMSGSNNNWVTTLPMPPGLSSGVYYIIYTHDVLNLLQEDNETDNSNFAVIEIDSIFKPIIRDDFEGPKQYWTTYSSSYSDYIPNTHSTYWKLGDNEDHHIYGTHSGLKSWYLYVVPSTSWLYSSLESPYMDLTTDTNLFFCFWYKLENQWDSIYNVHVEFSKSNDYPYYNASPEVSVENTRHSNWDCKCVDLNYLEGYGNARVRVVHKTISNTSFTDRLNVDDVYIGPPKPDLSIEHKNRLSTYTYTATDTLRYEYCNSGVIAAGSAVSEFYWSADSVWDVADVLLVSVAETPVMNTAFTVHKFQYTKPTLALGVYYILYRLDVHDSIDEMWESNNAGFFRIEQTNLTPTPYFNDFETQIDGWEHLATAGCDKWEWGTPQGVVLNQVFSGQKGFYTLFDSCDYQTSLINLYTPTFDISTMTHPVLDFDMMLQTIGLNNTYAKVAMNMSYTIDNGASWQVLDTNGQSFKAWYYPIVYYESVGIDNFYHVVPQTDYLYDVFESKFIGYNSYQSRDSRRSTKYIIDLGFLNHPETIRFRYNMGLIWPSNSDGAVIDNFCIAEGKPDLMVDEFKNLLISPLRQQIRFFMNIMNQGNYIASPSIVKFYLSSDTIKDAGDVWLGADTLPNIRPDMMSYINVNFACPYNLNNYGYILYELDAENANAESDETNNTGFLELGLGGIDSFPYFEEFSDSITNGWTHYVTNQSGVPLTTGWRVRSFLAPYEPVYNNQSIGSGFLFTDRVMDQSYFTAFPVWYIESPNFNFMNAQNISLEFNMICVGVSYFTSTAGGNMQFSTDGGNTWTVLDTSMGNAERWYNMVQVESLDNQPGWTSFDFAHMDTSRFDLSFLAGEENVVFRYKFSSKHTYTTEQGFVLDKFSITTSAIDYIATDSMTTINADISDTELAFSYHIQNSGTGDGPPTKTRFYWSGDPVFDTSDFLVKGILEAPINAGQVLQCDTSTICPLPITQLTYYLFYICDADSDLVESSEFNNVGSFRVVFDSISGSGMDAANGKKFDVYNEGRRLFIESDWAFDEPFDLLVFDMKGSLSFATSLIIREGLTTEILPASLKSGCYAITISNNANSVRRKICFANE